MLVQGANFTYYAEYPGQSEAQWLCDMAHQVVNAVLYRNFFKKETDVAELLWKHWDNETACTVRYVITNRRMP